LETWSMYPQSATCSWGYVDSTQGAAYFWACGVTCPVKYWVDGSCGCACVWVGLAAGTTPQPAVTTTPTVLPLSSSQVSTAAPLAATVDLFRNKTREPTTLHGAQGQQREGAASWVTVLIVMLASSCTLVMCCVCCCVFSLQPKLSKVHAEPDPESGLPLEKRLSISSGIPGFEWDIASHSTSASSRSPRPEMIHTPSNGSNNSSCAPGKLPESQGNVSLGFSHSPRPTGNLDRSGEGPTQSTNARSGFLPVPGDTSLQRARSLSPRPVCDADLGSAARKRASSMDALPCHTSMPVAPVWSRTMLPGGVAIYDAHIPRRASARGLRTTGQVDLMDDPRQIQYKNTRVPSRSPRSCRSPSRPR
jgi:hypothetical protein